MSEEAQQQIVSLDSRRLIGQKELLQLVPYTLQHIYRLERAGEFPRRVKIGRKRVAWVFAEVDSWLISRLNARNCGVGAQDMIEAWKASQSPRSQVAAPKEEPKPSEIESDRDASQIDCRPLPPRLPRRLSWR